MIKLKNKKQINIHYHSLKGQLTKYEFSFVGYRTKNGLHGIHYCQTKKFLFFWHAGVRISKKFTYDTTRDYYTRFPTNLKVHFLK